MFTMQTNPKVPQDHEVLSKTSRQHNVQESDTNSTKGICPASLRLNETVVTKSFCKE